MSSRSQKGAAGGPDPFEAFRSVVYDAGVVDMAAVLGHKVGTLYNKADSDYTTKAQPTLRDLVLVTRLTGDFRVLDALDEMFGRAAFDVRPFEHLSDAALLELVAKLGTEKGEFFTALGRALQGNFSREATNRVRAEAYDVISALMAVVVVRVEGLVDE